ncbi:MAG TPA: alpha/beta fold hydrolase [Nodosilinea sp.]|nr:alpha/beta fold hydrolase [Nodosilinea sp.]
MPVSVLPATAAALSEPTSVDLAARVQVAAIATPLVEGPIPTAYVADGAGAGPPLLLIHGFDSSLFEFRRLLPLLAAQGPVWAVDLLGFGFSDRTLSPDLSPGAIKLHLHSFWRQQIGRPVVLVGASMGGAAALDFALTYPEAVAGLVLIDAAGFAAGPAMGNLMVPPLDSWATAFLRNPRVRRSISRQAYFDKAFVTADAELCAALHLQCPGWKEALIAFTKTGGYNFLTAKIPQIACPTRVIWGEQDKILGTKDARRFEAAIATCDLVWIPQCGHVPHLEKPQATAAAILPFVARLEPQAGQ